MLYSSLFNQFPKRVAPYLSKVTNEFLEYNYEFMDLNIFDKFQYISVIFPTDAQVSSLASGSLFQLPLESFLTQSNISKLPCFLVMTRHSRLILYIPCPSSGISLFTKKPCFFTVKLPIFF